ncbi:MAG: hypothetical protein ACPGSD_17190 [Flavobacteriales bacterium]
MEIEIEKKIITIDETTEIARGGEGVIHSLNNDTLLKVIKEQVLNENKIKKILAFCDKTVQISNESEQPWISSPISPAYLLNHNQRYNNLKGFTMSYFNNTEELGKIKFDLRKNAFKRNVVSDLEAISIVESIFEKLQLLHRNKIIIGDINSLNFLVEKVTKEIFLIDVDSYQIGEFVCPFISEEYVDVNVYEKGATNNGGFHYSIDSDIFALSVLCFEFIIGTRPFEIGVIPYIDKFEAQKRGVSLIDYHYLNTKTIKNHHLIERDELQDVLNRLSEVKRICPKLYMFFVDIFHHKKRIYYQKLAFNNSRKRVRKVVENSNRIVKPIRGYQILKKDPIELKMFLGQFNIKTDWLCI